MWQCLILQHLRACRQRRSLIMITSYEGYLMIFFNDLAVLIFPRTHSYKKGEKLAQLLTPILYTYKAGKICNEKNKI